MTMGQMRDIPLGCPVYTSDGDKLGTVKEVRDGAFKIDAHMQPDYWLPLSAVASSMTDRLTTSFDKGRLGDFKAGSPTELRPPAMPGATAMSSSGSMPSGVQSRAETRPSPLSTGTGPMASSMSSTGAQTMTSTGGVRSWNDVMPEYRQTWQARSGNSGRRWEEVEPGYRYGYEMANDPRYQNRQWSDVETDLNRDYPTWAQNQGYPTMTNGWTNSQQDVQDAWDRVRNGGNRNS
jgi:hypothetical protein